MGENCGRTSSLARRAARGASRVAQVARGERDRLAAGRELPGILALLRESAFEGAEMRVLGSRVTRGGSILIEVIVGRHVPVIVKMSRRPAQAANLRRQARLLRVLHKHPRLEAFRSLTPIPLLAGEKSEWTYLVESRLPGVRQSGEQAKGRRNVLEALSTISLLHRETSCPTTLDDRLVRRWVGSRARAVAELMGARLGGAGERALVQLEADLRAQLVGRSGHVSWVHGDYWPGNVLVTGSGSIVGVLDWDSLQSRELPLHDTLHYVVTARRLAEGQHWGLTIRQMLTESAQTEAEHFALAGTHTDALGIDRRTALLLYWLRGVALNRRRDPVTTSHPSWLEPNVQRVLDALS